MAETGYFELKMPAKGGLHIIIADMNRAAVAVLGAAGAIWALEHPSAGSGLAAFEGNPYLEDIPKLIGQIKESNPSSRPSPARGEGVNGKGDGQENKSLVSSFKIRNRGRL